MSVLDQAVKLAQEQRSRAYAPYSGFLVGAAVKPVGSRKLYGGCNIENASFGASLCAERTALFSAIAELGRGELEFVVVATDVAPVAVPCALCLQALAEFCPPSLPIYLANLSGIQKTYRLDALLPHPFTLKQEK